MKAARGQSNLDAVLTHTPPKSDRSAPKNTGHGSRKFGLIGRGAVKFPLFETELPHEQHAVGVRHPYPEFEVVPIGVVCRIVPMHRDATGSAPRVF